MTSILLADCYIYSRTCNSKTFFARMDINPKQVHHLLIANMYLPAIDFGCNTIACLFCNVVYRAVVLLLWVSRTKCRCDRMRRKALHMSRKMKQLFF